MLLVVVIGILLRSALWLLWESVAPVVRPHCEQGLGQRVEMEQGTSLPIRFAYCLRKIDKMRDGNGRHDHGGVDLSSMSMVTVMPPMMMVMLTLI